MDLCSFTFDHPNGTKWTCVAKRGRQWCLCAPSLRADGLTPPHDIPIRVGDLLARDVEPLGTTLVFELEQARARCAAEFCVVRIGRSHYDAALILEMAERAGWEYHDTLRLFALQDEDYAPLHVVCGGIVGFVAHRRVIGDDAVTAMEITAP